MVTMVPKMADRVRKRNFPLVLDTLIKFCAPPMRKVKNGGEIGEKGQRKNGWKQNYIRKSDHKCCYQLNATNCNSDGSLQLENCNKKDIYIST